MVINARSQRTIDRKVRNEDSVNRSRENKQITLDSVPETALASTFMKKVNNI